ncbi:MAG: hypothetical protein ACYS5V_14270 [Planctomycetota bacterium]|jgi:hypothetical protein
MIAERTPSFDDRLADAITAENPADALETLRRQPAADPDLTEQVRQALGLVDDLCALGEAIGRIPAPRLQLPDLTPRARLRWRWVVSAAAVAATIIAAISLLSITPTPDGDRASPAESVSLSLDWDIPSIEAVSLTDQSFSLPEVTMPSLSSLGFTWSIPPLEMPSAPAGDDADTPDGTTRPAASACPRDRLNQRVYA